MCFSKDYYVKKNNYLSILFVIRNKIIELACDHPLNPFILYYNLHYYAIAKERKWVFNK